MGALTRSGRIAMVKNITYQEINNLIDGIDAGDPESIAKAQDISARLSKRANTRLRALEKEGLTSGKAYQRAKYFLSEDQNREYFSQSKKLTGDELKENLERVSDFLNNPQSTLTYERERRAGFEKMEDIFPEDFGGTERKSLRDFLSSEAWQEFKSTIYIHRKGRVTEAESEEARAAIAGAADAISRGASVNDLKRLYEKYREQVSEGEDASIFDVFEEWEEF